MLLLLLLSCFSRVRLCATPWTAACQASRSMGFSRRELEWVAISFSNAWKWKLKVKSLSRVWLLATPWTAAHQAPPSVGFSGQQYWSGVPLPSPVPLFLMYKRRKWSPVFSQVPWLAKLGYLKPSLWGHQQPWLTCSSSLSSVTEALLTSSS